MAVPGDDYAFEERCWSEPAKPYDADAIQPWVDMYDGAISYVDAQLGRLRVALIERGLADNTLVVIVGDHGELFGEQGQIMHTWSLYAPVLHVPLVIVSPGEVPGGLRISDEVTVRDLPATILDIVDLAADSPLPGESWAGLWGLGDGFRGSSPVLSEAERAPDLDFRPRTPLARGDMSALLEQGPHYIRNGDGSEELYDVRNDPKLLVDLTPDMAYATALLRLRGRLDSLDVARER
ncbi:MAG: sulfatase-like hydrolase/transferase [Gemmatimonadota bacterium]